jgi:hypothetical protein
MPDFFWDLLFCGLLGLGAVATVIGVATDDGDPTAERGQGPQKRQSRDAASARAVIIRRRPIAGCKLALDIILSVGLAVGVPKIQTQATLALLCEHVGAAQTLHLLLLLVFAGLPILLMLPSVPIAIQSIRMLRCGYAPPRDSAPTHDTVTVAGWRPQLRGVAGRVVMPALVGFTGDVTYDARQTFEAKAANLSMASGCPSGPTPKGARSP